MRNVCREGDSGARVLLELAEEEKRGETSWQMLGACGVEPFKARSLDARRRNGPPRVALAPTKVHGSSHSVSLPPSLHSPLRTPWEQTNHARHTSLRETSSTSSTCLPTAFLDATILSFRRVPHRTDRGSWAFPL